MTNLFDNDTIQGSAVFSLCERYRYRLERDVQTSGCVIAYFGINGSFASAHVNDQTVRKWIGFTPRFGGRKFIVGNAFGYRSQDVRALALVEDPIGPDNAAHLAAIINDADILVPCWGSRLKIPRRLRPHLDALYLMLHASRKPIKIFGLTHSGDPMHPLMLGYDTPLQAWEGTL